MIEIAEPGVITPRQVHRQGGTQIVINAAVTVSTAVGDEPTTDEWAQVSTSSFARDWDSDTDRRYDDL